MDEGQAVVYKAQNVVSIILPCDGWDIDVVGFYWDFDDVREVGFDVFVEELQVGRAGRPVLLWVGVEASCWKGLGIPMQPSESLYASCSSLIKMSPLLSCFSVVSFSRDRLSKFSHSRKAAS